MLSTARAGVPRGCLRRAARPAARLSAIAFTGASRAFWWLGRHHAALQLTGATVLIAIGMLVVSGELYRLNIEAQRLLDGLGLNFFNSI